MIGRLLKRWAWRLVKDEAETVAREHAAAAVNIATAEAASALVKVSHQIIDHNTRTIVELGDTAADAHRRLIDNLVEILNASGIPCQRVEDSGFEVIPPGKMH